MISCSRLWQYTWSQGIHLLQTMIPSLCHFRSPHLTTIPQSQLKIPPFLQPPCYHLYIYKHWHYLYKKDQELLVSEKSQITPSNPEMFLFPNLICNGGDTKNETRSHQPQQKDLQVGERSGEYGLCTARSLNSTCCLSHQARVMTASLPGRWILSLLLFFPTSGCCALPARLQRPAKTVVGTVAAHMH